MAMTAEINDTEFNLLFKQAQNWYDSAVANGISGLNPPNLNDTEQVLLSKICYYTASLV